jgi:hypothetical protein
MICAQETSPHKTDPSIDLLGQPEILSKLPVFVDASRSSRDRRRPTVYHGYGNLSRGVFHFKPIVLTALRARAQRQAHADPADAGKDEINAEKQAEDIEPR